MKTALLLAGMANTMLGPLMPGFEARWHTGDARSGLLFAAQFLASVLTAAAVRPLAARRGYHRLVAYGLALVAAGVAVCAMASAWWMALAGVAVYGCGLGLGIPAGNLAAPGARAVMLANLAWCVGAVVAPFIIGMIGGVPFLWALAACAALVAAWLIARYRRAQVTAKLTARSCKPPARSVTALASALLFVYVGTEASIAGWVSTFAERARSSAGLWVALPSIFWAAMLTGRAFSPVVLARVRPRALLVWGLTCAFAGACLLVATPWMAVASAIAGIGLSPVFPLVVAEYAESGLVFSAAGLGGAALPPAIGFVSQITGSLRAAMCAAPLLIAVMLWLHFRLARAAGES